MSRKTNTNKSSVLNPVFHKEVSGFSLFKDKVSGQYMTIFNNSWYSCKTAEVKRLLSGKSGWTGMSILSLSFLAACGGGSSGGSSGTAATTPVAAGAALAPGQIPGSNGRLIVGTSGDDAFSLGADNNDNQVNAGAGNDIVVLGNGNNIVRGGAGADDIRVGTGNNVIVIVGANNNGNRYADSALSANGVSLRNVVSLADINNGGTATDVATPQGTLRDTITLGTAAAGGHTLVIYGAVDLTQVTITGTFRTVVLNSELKLNAATLNGGLSNGGGPNFVRIIGDGSSKIVLTGEGLIEASALRGLSGVANIEIARGVTLRVDAADEVTALNNAQVAITGAGRLAVDSDLTFAANSLANVTLGDGLRVIRATTVDGNGAANLTALVDPATPTEAVSATITALGAAVGLRSIATNAAGEVTRVESVTKTVTSFTQFDKGANSALVALTGNALPSSVEINNADFGAAHGVIITGTISAALGADERVKVSLGSASTYAVMSATAPSGALTTWTATFGGAANTPGAGLIPATDAAATVTAQVVHISGVAGASLRATGTVAIDAVEPPRPFIATIAGDDKINKAEKDAEAGISITVSAEANSLVKINWGGAGIGSSDGTNKEIQLANGATSATFTFRGAEIPNDGSRVVTVTATDRAGNVSAAATKSVDIDSGVPVAPVLTASDFTTVLAVGGVAGSDNTLSVAERSPGLRIHGTGEAGATVSVSTGTGSAVTETIPANGRWIVTIPVANIPTSGEFTITASQTDSAGNRSPNVTLAGIKVNTVVPPAPTITQTASTIAGDGTVNATESAGVTVSGTNEAGATVSVSTGTGSAITATVSGTNWTAVIPSGNLPASGTNFTVSVTQTNAAGNVSAAATIADVKVDTVAPTVTSSSVNSDGNIVIGFDSATITDIQATSSNSNTNPVVASTSANVTSATLTKANIANDGDGFRLTDTAGNTTEFKRSAIAGTAGNDIVVGTDGTAATLAGQAGSDIIIGGTAAETIIGGAGNDFLTGGGGVDTFQFGADLATNGKDTITDFTVGTGGDKLDLRLFTAGSPGGGWVLQTANADGSGAATVFTKGAGNGGATVTDKKFYVLDNVSDLSASATGQDIINNFFTGGGNTSNPFNGGATPPTATKAVFLVTNGSGAASLWFFDNNLASGTTIAAGDFTRLADLNDVQGADFRSIIAANLELN